MAMVYIREDVYREIVLLSKLLKKDVQTIMNDWLKLSIDKLKEDKQVKHLLDELDKNSNQKL